MTLILLMYDRDIMKWLSEMWSNLKSKHNTIKKIESNKINARLIALKWHSDIQMKYLNITRTCVNKDLTFKFMI